MSVFVGTSGWQYKHWKQSFYNAVPQNRWLEHYSEMFQTVEVNNAFYKLPEKSTFERWYNATPDDFIFAIKMSRFLTHVKRMKDPSEPVARFLDRVEILGKKCGPVLLQLPPNFSASPNLLTDTLAQFPQHFHVAIEFRHNSWFSDDVYEILKDANVALCLADSPHFRVPLPFWRTADWGYVRLHEGRATPFPCYGIKALRTWAKRVANTWTQDEDVYVYFNNDANGCAVRNAELFVHLFDKK